MANGPVARQGRSTTYTVVWTKSEGSILKLYVSQKLMSWGGKYLVRDEDGNLKYYINGKPLTFARRLSVLDTEDCEVAAVRQKMWCIFPQYSIFCNGKAVAEIKRVGSYFKPRYIVEKQDWLVEGDFLGHRYTISCGDRVVAEIRKAWMTWGDNYVLDIKEPKDEIAALVTVVVIDCVTASNSN